jgi:hypothetical protein
VESTKVEIVPANIKLWDLTKIPDICNWPTAYEAKWKDISSADEIESLLYTYSLPTSQKREKGNRACSPLNQGSPFASIPSSAIAPEGTSA